MQRTRPHIVLVHGAWHVPEHYKTLIDLLHDEGYSVSCPQLPTCATPATSLFSDDVAVVRNLVTTLADQGLQIVMLLHSYGGIVGTEALQDLSFADRRNAGKAGGVVQLIYMCAFLLQAGQSAATASLPRPDPEHLEIREDEGTTFLAVDPKHLFYNDLDERKATEMEQMLVRHSYKALGGGIVTYPAWKYIRTAYFECTLDQVLFPHWQKEQIQAARNAGADIQVFSYASSHSPFLSIPNKMVEAVNELVVSCT